jgi:C4-dicarboxylate transporter DctM subunit
MSAMITIVGAKTLPIAYIAQVCFTSIDTFPIMAIPFFVAAGVFMGEGGLSNRLLKVADELMGGFYGGMALTAITATFFFAAISGSGPATVAAIATLTIPAMIQRGYCPYFSGALVAAAGSLGVILPPSNPFVVYGVSAQASIGKLFIAGILPGLVMYVILMIFAYIYSRRKGLRGEARERSMKSISLAMWDAKWALAVPIIILGGIYGGIMTPTEAASIAALYGLLVGVFIYKGINMSNIVNCLITACRMSAVIITLIAMATLFGNIMTIEQVPAKIAAWVLSITDSKILILLMINIMLLAIGTVMEALAAIVILTPILLPVVVQVGVDPIHFGVIMVVNLAIGFITPPVGVNLFVVSGIANLKISRLFMAALPIAAVMLIVLLMVTYIPDLSLYLPKMMK